MRPCPEPSRLDRDTHHISRIPLAGTRHAAALGCKEGRDMSLGTGATLWQGACLWPLAPLPPPPSSSSLTAVPCLSLLYHIYEMSGYIRL